MDDSVVCWGLDDDGQASPPHGAFASVSAGESHSCGVRTDGPVECWGFDFFGQASPPEGAFASVSAGRSHSCGVRTDSSIACWGSDSSHQVSGRGWEGVAFPTEPVVGTGCGPLYDAVANRDVEATRTLVNAGADVNAECRGESVLLFKALDEFDPEIVRILVDAGADVNAVGSLHSAGESALYEAVSPLGFGEPHPEIVRILVDAGADVNFEIDGRSVLYAAVAHRSAHPEIVRILVDAGADVNAQGVLDGARTGFGHNPEIVQILIDAGAVE